MDSTWGIAKALYFGNQSLMPTSYYQSIHNRILKARGTVHISVPIYRACKAALENKDTKLTQSQSRALTKITLEGRLNGLELAPKMKDHFDFSHRKIIVRQDEVNKKILCATKLFKHQITNPTVVKDFPEDYLKIIAVDPANPQKGPWKITLEPHIMTPFMELCPSSDLRWNVWQALVTRGYQGDENNLRTSTAIETIRDHRMKYSKLLGYKSYAHLSMETKMAGSLDNVYNVLDTLLDAAYPSQMVELNELEKFAQERGFDNTLRDWDIDYWARKHRRSVLNVKDEILRDYFPLPIVLRGLFDLVERLFDVKMVETRKTDVWHPDVRFFDVIDLNGSSDEPIASFYLDPYAKRDNGLRMQRDAGWMVAIRNRSVPTSTKPLAALIFNFQRPTNDKPSLLSFRDVAVLFHKFGYALQHLLTKAELSTVAGMSNVEWDATGISGHFLENWLYEPSMIRQVSSHYDTAAPLPEDFVQSLTNIRSHMAGFKLSQELYYSKFDMKLHELDEFWVPMMERLWKEHFVIPLDKTNNHLTSWVEIFVGQWGAAYYSDVWARMAAADAYSTFQELPAGDKKLEKETATRYRETFLSLGGSVPALEVFRKFRGRDPNPKALLKNLCLRTDQTEQPE
ncbi:probable cytosolic oligopeptidase A isoform X2 [Venturia canescens]|nr:probable cytosolic oligopeptidase A isoform X2 [Venturia canescens]XP_043285116.1 probable cytosolic oligopeptidase A isoform X2 [Venturia canescens]